MDKIIGIGIIVIAITFIVIRFYRILTKKSSACNCGCTSCNTSQKINLNSKQNKSTCNCKYCEIKENEK